MSCGVDRTAHLFFLFMKPKIQKKKETLHRRLVSVLAKVALFIIVPLLAVVAIGHLLDIPAQYLFPISFVVSWAFIIGMYKRISKEMADTAGSVSDLKQD